MGGDIEVKRRSSTSANRQRGDEIQVQRRPPLKNDNNGKDTKNSTDNNDNNLNPSKRGGLLTAPQVKAAHESKAQERQSRLENPIGQNAGTIYRDKITGKKMKLEDILEEERKRHKEDESAPEYTWGKGVVQAREKERQKEEEDREREKPLARYADDVDLNILQMAERRREDPMLQYLEAKKQEKRLRHGQKVSKKRAKPMLLWDNRYNIKPGKHWDGVNRSNGFERRLFNSMYKQETDKERDYQWSVSDM